MAHHTRQEAIESLPGWRKLVADSLVELDAAIAVGDWVALRNAAQNLKWAGTNLHLRSADLQEHDAVKLNRVVPRTEHAR